MHATQILDALALLRSDRSLCDVFLQTQEEADEAEEAAGEARGVWAHRVVLAAASPYFLAMFTRFAERTEHVVIIKDVETAALRAVIDYIYSPTSLSVTTSNSQALLSAGSLLAVNGVRDAACAFLESELAADNALGIRTFAEQHGCAELATAAGRFIQDHSEDVLQADELLTLTADALATLLDSLTGSIEEHVLDAVLRWIQHGPQDRQRHLGDLLQHVRLPLLPREVLAERVSTKPLVSTEPLINHLLIKALAFHCQRPDRQALAVAGSNWYRQRQPRSSSALLMVGGVGSCDVVYCQLSTGRWQPAAALPESRSAAAAAVINGCVYVAGGVNGSCRLSSVVMFDVATGSWTAGPSLRIARSWLGVAVSGGVLYAAGGEGPSGVVLSSAERLDPREGVWRPVASMSTTRRGPGVAVLDGRLYSVGGFNGYEYLNTVERYDPAAGRWEAMEQMAQRRANVGLSVVDNAMYAVGGYNGSCTLRSMERYRATSGWESAPSLGAPRYEPAVAAHAGRIYVAGGLDLCLDFVSSVAVFDPASAAWSELPTAMPAGRWSVAAVVVDRPPSIKT